MPSAATAFFESKSPSSSPMAIKGERSSTYLPANGFSITAMAAARLVGGATVCPLSRYVSPATVTILRITALIVFRLVLRFQRSLDMYHAFRSTAAERRLQSGNLDPLHRHDDHLAMQTQYSRVDQSRREHLTRAGRAGLEP